MTTATLAGQDKPDAPVVADRGRLVVEIDDATREGWAAYMSDAGNAYLLAAEEYLGRELGKGSPIRVGGGEDVRIDGRWVGGYADVPERRVYIQYDLAPIGNPSLLYHELGHLWFAENVTDQAWLFEGIVSFLPLALGEAGVPTPDADAAWRHWGFRHTRYHRDLPTETDFRRDSPDDFTDWYRKTFKIQFLIFRELGAAGYRTFLRSLLAGAPAVGPAAVLDMLAAQKNIDWHEFLSGWVFGEVYRRFSWNDFADRDHDGLIDVEEHYVGTDPHSPDTDADGVPDGAELRLGADPLRPDDSLDPSRTGPFVDGNDAEWDRRPATTVTDRVNDSSGDSSLDLVRMRYLVRGPYLYVAVETRTAPLPREGIFFDVLRDRDLDGSYDGDFAFWLDHPAAPWQYDDGIVLLPGLEGAIGEVYEMAIPLEQLGDGPFQILPILRDAAGEFNYDEWDTWVRVETAD